MTSRLATICPHCHRIVPARTTCPCRVQTNAERLVAQPYRDAYSDPAYRRNRAKRYEQAGGRCESCGAPLRGVLHPLGKPWQCDHHIEARRFADPRMANAVENLRCYCTDCHAGARKPK